MAFSVGSMPELVRLPCQMLPLSPKSTQTESVCIVKPSTWEDNWSTVLDKEISHHSTEHGGSDPSQSTTCYDCLLHHLKHTSVTVGFKKWLMHFRIKTF